MAQSAKFCGPRWWPSINLGWCIVLKIQLYLFFGVFGHAICEKLQSATGAIRLPVARKPLFPWPEWRPGSHGGISCIGLKCTYRKVLLSFLHCNYIWWIFQWLDFLWNLLPGWIRIRLRKLVDDRGTLFLNIRVDRTILIVLSILQICFEQWCANGRCDPDCLRFQSCKRRSRNQRYWSTSSRWIALCLFMLLVSDHIWIIFAGFKYLYIILIIL